MPIYPDLVENITRVMDSRGISRADLVGHVGNASVIDKTFAKQRYLDGCMLAKLANVLGVSVEDLKMQY